MSRILKFAIPICILALLIGWRLYANNIAAKSLVRGGKRGPAVVAVASVVKRDVVHTFSNTANIESPETIKISPKVSGQILQITVNEGAPVKVGQVLVKLDNTEYVAAVRKQEALLAQAQARYQQAKVTQNSVNVGIGTQIQQNNAGVISARADYNQTSQNYSAQVAAAHAAVLDATGKVESAKAAIATAQASLNNAIANRDNANVLLSRDTALLNQGAIAREEVDNARTAAAVQQGSVGVAQAQLNAAQANLSSAQSQLKAAQQQESIAIKKGKSDIDAAHTRYVQAQGLLTNAHANTSQKEAFIANLAALAADIKSTQADLDNARIQLSQTVLTSNIDGFVSSRLADPGSLASSNQPILNLQTYHKVWVNFPVPEEEIGYIHQGQTGVVSVDAIPGKTFTGKVFQINPSADPSSRNFTVRLILDNATGLLKPGMFARVTMVTQQLQHADVLPLEAIQTDTDGKSFVWTVVPDPKSNSSNQDKPALIAQKVPVTLGMRDENGVAVLSALPEETHVITTGASRLKDGQPVMVGGLGKPGKHKGGRKS